MEIGSGRDRFWFMAGHGCLELLVLDIHFPFFPPPQLVISTYPCTRHSSAVQDIDDVCSLVDYRAGLGDSPYLSFV
jgi:hypothetical protein